MPKNTRRILLPTMVAAILTRTAVVAAFRPSMPSLATRNLRLFASVTGSVYESDSGPVVTLYTKEGCTLCDKVKDVLKQVQEETPHSLKQVDITDEDQQDSFDRYKYDIPVLHISSSDEDAAYWTKHRLTPEEAKEGIAEAMSGSFEPRKGRPNAAAMER